ncbi:MAG: hypothetical protein KDB07_09120 [Planctomycetes bacterium]|nr:hypothetical protein [Planctomycetota bacterium]
MASNDNTSNAAMGWFLAIMALLALGLGIAVMYKQKGISADSAVHSMEGYQGRQAERVKFMREIKDYLKPSLEDAYKVKDRYVSESMIQNTRRNLTAKKSLLGEELDRKVKIEDESPSNANQRDQFIRVSMPISGKELTRLEVESLLRMIVQESGKYATISDINLKASKLKVADLGSVVDEGKFAWDLSLNLVWFIPNPSFNKGSQSARARGV